MASLAVVWADEGELADLHAQAERLGVPVSRVIQEAWRLARATIRAASARIAVLRAQMLAPKTRKPTPARSPAPAPLDLPPILTSAPTPEPRPWVAWSEGDPTI